MIIQIISDTHLEFHHDKGKSFLNTLPIVGDVLVVAGDLATVNLLEKSIIKLCNRFPEVIYVIGNHEYYDSSFQQTEEIVYDMQSKLNNFTWLNNKRIVINGQAFLGDTLWFYEDVRKRKLKGCLSDFSYISKFEPEVYERYEKTYEFLEKNTQKGDIVVTHHMPSEACVADRFKGSPINCWFYTPCERIIKATEPSIWISGHTHESYDFTLYNTRLICNPLGYPHECNESRGHFDDSLIVEV